MQQGSWASNILTTKENLLREKILKGLIVHHANRIKPCIVHAIWFSTQQSRSSSMFTSSVFHHSHCPRQDRISFSTFPVEWKRGCPVFFSLPVWDHSSHWWNPVDQHSDHSHLFKVCHSGLGGSLFWQNTVLTLWYALYSPHPSVHHELLAGALSWTRSTWDWSEICQIVQYTSTEPGSESKCPIAINPVHCSSPCGNLAQHKVLFSISIPYYSGVVGLARIHQSPRRMSVGVSKRTVKKICIMDCFCSETWTPTTLTIQTL